MLETGASSRFWDWWVLFSGGATPGRVRSNDLAGRPTAVAIRLASVIVWTENKNVTISDSFICFILTVKNQRRWWWPGLRIFWHRNDLAPSLRCLIGALLHREREYPLPIFPIGIPWEWEWTWCSYTVMGLGGNFCKCLHCSLVVWLTREDDSCQCIATRRPHDVAPVVRGGFWPFFLLFTGVQSNFWHRR